MIEHVDHSRVRIHSLWFEIRFYSDFHCSDPRDRVFGLLALARPSFTPFQPDYTKSPMQVFLQLLEHEAFRNKDRGDDVHLFLGHALSVLQSLRLDSYAVDVQQMLQARRSIHHTLPSNLDLILEDLDRNL